jgi:3-oxoacyl-[acyl-carrier-protein] synthase-3
MGTVIDQIATVKGGWRQRHSALRVAVLAAEKCLQAGARTPHDVDLLINAGIYRDRNLGEPALAALIQHDIGANPEDPHQGAHGTFSFDIANGSCGVLSALQIVDGFLSSRAIDCALVVASDADPGHRMSEHFPFSPFGAALLCSWRDDDSGLGRAYWANDSAHSDAINSTVQMVGHRNVLRVTAAADSDERLADTAAEAAKACLHGSGCAATDVAAIVTAPAGRGYQAALAARLGVPPSRITVAGAGAEKAHTASLAAAFDQVRGRAGNGARILLVAAGAGLTAGAVLYRDRAA